MKPPSERQAASEIVDSLAELLGTRTKAIRFQPAQSKGYDCLISAPGYRFIVEYKKVASAGPLADAINSLKLAVKALPDKAQALIVVPFMGDVGKVICERSSVSWLDPSGNAQIYA